MIKVENIDVWGFEHAIRGMRNPLNSWDKSDSYPAVDCGKCGKLERDGICRAEDRDCTGFECYDIGKNDLNLMKRLFKGGTEHRKYARQIMVSMDITSHHTWWAEFDTYKIGVTRNSCSKMHKIHVKEFLAEDFSTEGISECGGKTVDVFATVLVELERLRVLFNETHEKKYWRAIIELLPMGYNLRATVTMNYENVFNIVEQREGHKVYEWNEFVDVLLGLPYVTDILERM
jgi:hypothetical protein